MTTGRTRVERILEIFTFASALFFVGLVGLGRWGERTHVFESSIVTSASPASLFAALLDPEALRSLGPIPGHGTLERVEWSRAPGRYARVTERYSEGSQVYWILEWDPPALIEERYVATAEGELGGIEVRQRWRTSKVPGGTRFSSEVELTPSAIQTSLEVLVEMYMDREGSAARGKERLERLAEHALLHPVSSTTTAIARVSIVPEK